MNTAKFAAIDDARSAQWLTLDRALRCNQINFKKKKVPGECRDDFRTFLLTQP